MKSHLWSRIYEVAPMKSHLWSRIYEVEHAYDHRGFYLLWDDNSNGNLVVFIFQIAIFTKYFPRWIFHLYGSAIWSIVSYDKKRTDCMEHYLHQGPFHRLYDFYSIKVSVDSFL